MDQIRRGGGNVLRLLFGAGEIRRVGKAPKARAHA
jgi:hypothetical protein